MSELRRHIMMQQAGGGLPYGYTQLEYIQVRCDGLGLSSIPYGAYPTNPTIKFGLYITDRQEASYGVTFRLWSNYFNLKMYNIQGNPSPFSKSRGFCDSYRAVNNTTYGVELAQYTLNNWHFFEMNPTQIIMDGVIYTSPNNGGNIGSYYYVQFLGFYNGLSNGFTIEDGGIMKMNFVPVRRDVDGVEGFYDICGSINPNTGNSFYPYIIPEHENE